MRKTILAALTALLLIGGFVGGAQAAPREEPGPGPNGSNEHGLCTAYFNGQKNGHTEGDGPGPFGVLEDDATAQDNADDNSDEDSAKSERDVSDDVFEFCQPYGIGGNPDHNGRWDCYVDEDKKTDDPRNTDGDNELECWPQGTGPDAPA